MDRKVDGQVAADFLTCSKATPMMFAQELCGCSAILRQRLFSCHFWICCNTLQISK